MKPIKAGLFAAAIYVAMVAYSAQVGHASNIARSGLDFGPLLSAAHLVVGLAVSLVNML